MIELNEQKIAEALEALNAGQVIVFPTETSYGIGCDATNADAVARIFAIKGRPSGKGLPVLIPDMAAADSFVSMSAKARDLAQKYWPGALNIVAPIAAGSPIAEACSQDGFQSVRVSSHPFTSILVHRFGKPIVATSANVSGDEPIFDPKLARELFRDRPGKPNLILDGGVIPVRPGSTTVKVVGNEVTILRQGEVEI